MDDSLQDLRVADLVTFLAVHRAKSVTAAARVLGVTPSQVSKAVARLEHALNVELLVRGPRGISTSDAGKQFAPRLEELVDRLQGLRSSEGVVKQPELTLAAPSYLHGAIVPRVAESLPDRRLRCLSMPQMLVRAYAGERLYQAAITIGKEKFPEHWVESELLPLRSGLFAAPALARSLGRGTIKPQALAEVPFISPIYVVNGQAVPVEDGCPLRRGDRVLGQEVETIGVGLELAKRGKQVVYGPAIAARSLLAAGELVEIQVAGWGDRTSEPLYLYCDGDQVLMRVQRALIESCTAALKE
jgi:DNA-binding transcriptional LysR family regulator